MIERKPCSACKRRRHPKFFNAKRDAKDGLQPWCRDCNRARSRRHYAANRDSHKKLVQVRKRTVKDELKRRVHDIKGRLGCRRCGENDPACLDFHHPEANKETSIAKAIGERWAWERIEVEIAKCFVLCSNCHRKHHARPLPNGATSVMADVHTHVPTPADIARVVRGEALARLNGDSSIIRTLGDCLGAAFSTSAKDRPILGPLQDTALVVLWPNRWPVSPTR